jgi:hypothetical protein
MGIAFTEIAPEEQQKLEAMIQALVGPTGEEPGAFDGGRASQGHVQSPLAATAANGTPVLERLRKYFETHEVLTRDEFAKIVGTPSAR